MIRPTSARTRAGAGCLSLIAIMAACQGDNDRAAERPDDTPTASAADRPLPPAGDARDTGPRSSGAIPAHPPDPVASPVSFRDVASSVGLHFEHVTGASGDFHFPEIMGAGAALLDIDGDGDLDVYLLQGGSPVAAAGDTEQPGNCMLRNDLVPTGELAFQDVSAPSGTAHRGYGMGAATGDVDNDGDVDLFVTNAGPDVLYRNDGAGSFSDVSGTAGIDDDRWSTSAAFLDYDRDGDLDLFVTHYVQYSTGAHSPCVDLTGIQDYCGPRSYPGLDDVLLRNEWVPTGELQFTDVTADAGLAVEPRAGLGVTCADFDGDGHTDIYVANDQEANLLWTNRGDGTFAERALLAGAAYNGHGAAEASMGVTAGDFDGDGDEDLFMSHLSTETNTLYVNRGAGMFRDATRRAGLDRGSLMSTGFGSAWFDADNDGHLDLFVANGAVQRQDAASTPGASPYAQPNLLYRNTGDGSFDAIAFTTADAPAETSRGAAFGDIDNDGDTDILVTQSGGPARLWRNELPDGGGWLGLRLRCADDSQHAVGARVALLQQGHAIAWRRAHSDGSYLSASDPRVHFGTGTHNGPFEVGVIWSDGTAERFVDLPGRRFASLVRGTGDEWSRDDAHDVAVPTSSAPR